MKYDIIELKWGAYEYPKNDGNYFNLVEYKTTQQSLASFINNQKLLGNHVALRYFINGSDLAQYMTLMWGVAILEVPGHYFNALSFNLQEKSCWYDKHYAWERIILKRLLCYALDLQDMTTKAISTLEDEDLKRFQEMLKYENEDVIMIYGCGCKDKVCGGWGIIVEENTDTISWDIKIRNHRKYKFEKRQYQEAFKEIKDFIEEKTSALI